jgi:hypothetical protein
LSSSPPSRAKATARHSGRPGAAAETGAAVGHRQHAVERGGERRGALRPGQRQGQRAVAHREALRRGVVERRRVGGEEEGLAHRRRRQAGAFERQARGAAVRRGFGARRPRRRARLRGGGGGEERCEGGVGARRGGDGEVEAEAAFFRDADLLADEPGRVGLYREGVAGGEGGRRGEGDRQQDLALVAEIDQRAVGDALRRRPFDRAGGGAFGEVQRDLGRRAGVAGVAPVGVPAGGEAQAEAEAEGLAGGDGVGLGRQGRGGAGGGDGRALPRRGGRRGGEEEKREDGGEEGHRGG